MSYDLTLRSSKAIDDALRESIFGVIRSAPGLAGCELDFAADSEGTDGRDLVTCFIPNDPQLAAPAFACFRDLALRHGLVLYDPQFGGDISAAYDQPLPPCFTAAAPLNAPPLAPVPTRLRANWAKSALLLTVSLLFVLAGWWMVLTGFWLGYLVIVFFGLCAIVFTLQFHPKAAYLLFDTDGFTYCSLFRAHTVRWEHVREFGIIRIASNPMVAWNFTRTYRDSGKSRALSKSLSGYEAALPDTYGLPAEDLLKQMETLRLQSAANRKLRNA